MNESHAIPGTAMPSFTKESIRKMEAELPQMLEYFRLYSKMLKSKYDALLVEGFTEEQALKLCKHLL